jgi:hypothetical protein
VFFEKVATPGEPFDIAPMGRAPDWVDPFDLLHSLIRGRGSANVSSFDSPIYTAASIVPLACAAGRATGPTEGSTRTWRERPRRSSPTQTG